MTVRARRREATLDKMADHLLANGLGGGSLRNLAAAAGTSDRMLLYYFLDKDDLLNSTLTRVADRQMRMLEQALPAGLRLPYDALFEALWSTVEAPVLQPFMNLWLELAAGAGRGIEPQRTIAARIATGFSGWLEDHLQLEPATDRAEAAALLLATFEGLLLLKSVGSTAVVDSAVARLRRPGGG